MLGCFEIVYQHLGLESRCDRSTLLQLFGDHWTTGAVAAFLRRLGWYAVSGPARDGDVVMVGMHPGVVKGGKITHLHHGRLVSVPLRRIRDYQTYRGMRCRRR